MPRLLADRCHDRLVGFLSCYDRIVITGTLPGACFADGMTKMLKARGIRVFHYATRDGTTPASCTVPIILLGKLQANGLPSADEVADTIDRAMLEFEAEGLDNSTIKAGHRPVQEIRSLVTQQTSAKSWEPTRTEAAEASACGAECFVIASFGEKTRRDLVLLVRRSGALAV